MLDPFCLSAPVSLAVILDWRTGVGSLSRFCVTGKAFEYYLAAADGSLPKAASLLAKDFNEHWWSADGFKSNVEKDKSKVVDCTSALRIEIARYIATLDQAKAKTSEFSEEIELLASLNVDGVLTTNWDHCWNRYFLGTRST
jgi:hypothetical protein